MGDGFLFEEREEEGGSPACAENEECDLFGLRGRRRGAGGCGEGFECHPD